MTARECFNKLVKDFFWAVRRELKDARFLGCLTPEQQQWPSVKDDIQKRFGVSGTYLKRLSVMSRKVSLDDFHASLAWMAAIVDGDHPAEVYARVARLLSATPLPRWKPRVRSQAKARATPRRA